MRGVWSGRVSIGTMHTMGPIDVSVAIAQFHARHPGVELSICEQSSEELAELLRRDDLDLAFLSVTERIESHGLGLAQLMLEELVLILPRRHRLSGRERVRVEELSDEEFVSYREGSRLREVLVSAAQEAGFSPTIMLESNESQRVRRLVARGMGVAILPRSDCVGPGADVAVARLAGPTLTRDITLAWRAERRLAPAAAEFLSLARQTFADGAASPRASCASPAARRAALR
jgi:LysR family transcriptional regulator, transcription activator of glutamate synthase operon